MMLARRSARPLTTLKTPNAVPCNSTGAVSFTQVLLAKLVSAGSPLLAFLGAFTPYDIVDEADSEEIARLHAHYVQSQEGAAKVSVARGDVSYTFAIMLIFERHARLKNLSRKQEKTTAYLPGAGLEPARTLPGPRDFKSRVSTNSTIRAQRNSIAYVALRFNRVCLFHLCCQFEGVFHVVGLQVRIG